MMLGISNLAWKNDIDVIDILRKHSIREIDICPMKYFSRDSTRLEVLSIKKFWENNGFHLNGMQALFYGVENCNIIDNPHVVIDHFTWCCKIAKILGISKLTFGAPSVRKGCTDDSIDFFRILGNIALDHSVVLCVEPVYGEEFCGNTFDTIQFVTLVDHQSVKLQLDTGVIISNNESVVNDMNIGHFHISVPKLTSLTNYSIELGNILSNVSYNDVMTIEMLNLTNYEIDMSIETIKELL